MNQIKKVRLELEISQMNLAIKAGINLRYLQRIESFKQTPNVYIAIRLAVALNSKVENLFSLS